MDRLRGCHDAKGREPFDALDSDNFQVLDAAAATTI